ncbi:Dor1-domain-containing protein, partial [Clavulina sp. PMI_390]
LNSPAVKSYLTHLSSLPLDTLLTEPGRLATESDILSSDLTQLCHSQHQTFLSLRSASNALSSSLGSLTSSLDTLLNDSIPNLESEARLFSENTKTIQQNRAKASLVLEHHEKLLDVLELPQLLATCIKNGYYSEALDLANHFERNLMSTLPPSTLLESIHTSVVASLQTLLQQLLQQLRAPAKLPVLFKTVNLLRRMEVCSEEQLAMAFILGRSAQLDDTFASANTSRDLEEDPAKWLRKWVEVFREGVYDVITQYSSIFLSTPSSTASPASVTNTMLLRSILSHTTQHYLSQLLSHLQTKLHTIPLGDMSSLASLLTQLSYCASSFARVGMDFRQALVPIVEEAILTIVGKGLASAAETLENTVTLRGNLPPGEWLVDAASAGSLPRRNSSAGGASQIHIPPLSLAHFPPIAQYTNMVLSALNALRLVPAPSIAERALELESESLQTVSAALLTYCKGRGVSSSSEESADERAQLAL